MRALEPWHLLILVLVVLVLFGAKRLPDAARGLGRSLRIFKSEVKQMQDESPRPAGRVFPHSPEHLPWHQRLWSLPAYRLFYDPDGSGSAAAMLFAQVTANTVVTAADFFAVA